MLPLGMWPECFEHTRGGAGAVLGGRRAAGRRGGAARPRPAGPAPPSWQACQPVLQPPAASVGGRRGWEAGVGATSGAPPARPGPARPRPSRCAGGWLSMRHARPAGPAPPRWPGRCPSAQGPAAAGGQGREGGGGPRGQGGALRLAGCAARHPLRGWPWPEPHLFVEQRY